MIAGGVQAPVIMRFRHFNKFREKMGFDAGGSIAWTVA
jgi:hypothetical protein